MAFQPQYLITFRSLSGAARALINYDVIEQSIQGHNEEHDSYGDRDTTNDEPGDHENLTLVITTKNQSDQGHNEGHDSYTGSSTENDEPQDLDNTVFTLQSSGDGDKYQLESIALNLDDEIVEGETRQAEVIANWTHESVDVTNDADYDSDNETVLTVDSTGFVEALEEGQATVTAFYLMEEDSVLVTVLAAEGELDGQVTSSGSLVHELQGVQVEVLGTGLTDLTASNGMYLIENIEIGTYDVEASHDDYENDIEENVEIEADQTTTVNFSLTPLDGSISGAVDSSGGIVGAIEGVSVSADNADNDTTDSGGEYTLENADGDENHIISYEHPDYENDTTDTNVFANQDVTGIDMTLNPLDGSIAGTATSGGSLVGGIEGVTVSTANANNDSTDQNGDYLLTEADGDSNHLVNFSSADYVNDSLSVNVFANEDATGEDIVLTPEDGSISGAVFTQHDEFALEGASVTSGTSSDTSGSGGEYSLSDMDGDETHQVTAALDGYDDGQINVDVFANQESEDENIGMLEELNHYIYFSDKDGGVELNTNRAVDEDRDQPIGPPSNPGDGTFLTTGPEERVFYMGAGDVVVRMSYDSGQENWVEDWGTQVFEQEEEQLVQELSVSNNYLFVGFNGTTAGDVTANVVEIFNPTTGASFDTEPLQYSEPGIVDMALGDSTTLYVGASGSNVTNDNIHQFNVDTGNDTLSQFGFYEADEGITGLDADDTYVYLAEDDGFLTRILRTDSTQTESVGPIQEIPQSISAGVDHVFVSYTNGYVAKIQKDPWNVVWTDQISSLSTVDFNVIKKGAGDDKIYVAATDETAYRLRDTGSGLHEPPRNMGSSDGKDLTAEPGTYGAFPSEWT